MENRILVFGDMMVDSYQVVTPQKVSQEAPVLVNQHINKHSIPGGAANAAIQMQTLFEVTPDVLGIVGGRLYTPVRSNKQRIVCDYAGMTLLSLLSKAKINKVLFPQDDWATIEKCRVIDTSGQQLMRIDTEPQVGPSEIVRKQILDWLADHSKDYDTVLISDYGKGTCFPQALRVGIEWFRGSFVVINGKPENAPYYKGADVVVMNLDEAQRTVGKPMSFTDDLAFTLNAKVGAPVIVTAGPHGMIWCQGGNTTVHIPAAPTPSQIVDITGAGDILCAAIASKGKPVSEGVLHWAAEKVSKAICNRRVRL
ncbi:MAG: PfkB family carbohydrate kinase [Candidatus Izemoplasmatales bacterium]